MRVIAYDHRLTVAVPTEFRRALDAVARLRGLTVPDLVRRELQASVFREHVPFRDFPDLERHPPRQGDPLNDEDTA